MPEIGDNEHIRLYHPDMPPIGTERNQEPVAIAPIPDYEYPSVPAQRPTPGTHPPTWGHFWPQVPAERVQDPENTNGVSFVDPQKQRELAPVSRQPTPARTPPFLPARRDPEYLPTPVQPVQEIGQDPVQETVSEPPAKQKPVKPLSEPEQAPENFKEKFKSPEISPEFLPENPEPKLGQKPEEGSEVKPQPKHTTKLFNKPKKVGRQRGKDRNNSGDGVRQLFELWWAKRSRGVQFPHFYRNHLSEDMRFYYPREYINHGANPKSAAEYRQWRKEWTAGSKASKTA